MVCAVFYPNPQHHASLKSAAPHGLQAYCDYRANDGGFVAFQQEGRATCRLPPRNSPTYAERIFPRICTAETAVNAPILDRTPVRRLQLFGLVLTVFVSVIGSGQPVFADEPLRYTLTGPSVVHIERSADGLYKYQTLESRFRLTQDAARHDEFVPRLITTTTKGSWDGTDEKYSVVVTIDELRGRTPRRVAKFSDPGTMGEVLGDTYYLTAVPPCCTDTGHFWFRSADTGKFLFKATGNGEVGATAFMYVQAVGAKVNTERWIAFEGNTDSNPDPTLLGHIRYGDRSGTLSDVQIRVKSDAPPWSRADGDWNEVEGAKECSFLQWLKDGAVHSTYGRRRPSPGGCDFKGDYLPEPFQSLPNGVNGIEVEYSISGDVYAVIPIVNDRLDIEHAQTASRIMLGRVAHQ